MKSKLLLILFVLTTHFSWSQNRDIVSEQPIILSHDGRKSHLIEDIEPAAVFFTTGNVQIQFSSTHYSSYSVRLTPSDGGEDIVVPVTSSTMTLPITNTTTDYVITVDGGDYGTYDGLFSPAGHTAVTLSDTQAMQLVKNRRENNTGVHFYSATVNTIINDARCPIDTMPAETWATDNSAKKLIL